MNMIALLLLVAAAILAFSLISGRTHDSMFTAPIAFTLLGLAFGLAGVGLEDNDLYKKILHILAEVTLVLLLFLDAARIDFRRLFSDHNLPVRMLLLGLPLSVALGTVFALWLPLDLTLAEATLLAAVLAPTDAALGQAVINNQRVPEHIRQAITVEAGLNDGISVPLVLLFAGMVAMSSGGEIQSAAEFAVFSLQQISVGIGVGIVAGWLGAKLIKDTVANGHMLEAFEGAAILALVAGLFALAEVLGGNGLIAAFTGGLLYGYRTGGHCDFVLDFAESEGRLLTLIVFTLFGAIMLPVLFAGVSWSMVVFALLALTVIRMVPVALSLLGGGLKLPTVLFLGWFGPRGLVSILFILLIAEKNGLELDHPVFVTAILTISFSIFLHGVSASPLAKRYSKLSGIADD